MTTRRGFLGGMLAAAAAPAFVKAGSLMPVRQIIVPPLVLWGDGIHDDTAALQAVLDGAEVLARDLCGLRIENGKIFLPAGNFVLSSTLVMDGKRGLTIQGDGTGKTVLIRGPWLPEFKPLIHVR